MRYAIVTKGKIWEVWSVHKTRAQAKRALAALRAAGIAAHLEG